MASPGAVASDDDILSAAGIKSSRPQSFASDADILAATKMTRPVSPVSNTLTRQPGQAVSPLHPTIQINGAVTQQGNYPQPAPPINALDMMRQGIKNVGPYPHPESTGPQMAGSTQGMQDAIARLVSLPGVALGNRIGGPIGGAIAGVSKGAGDVLNPVGLLNSTVQAIHNPVEAIRSIGTMGAKAVTPSTQTPEDYWRNLTGLLALGAGGVEGLSRLRGLDVPGLPKSAGVTEHMTPVETPSPAKMAQEQVHSPQPVSPAQAPVVAPVEPVQAKAQPVVKPAAPQGRVVDASGLHAMQNWRDIAQNDLDLLNKQLADSVTQKQAKRLGGNVWPANVLYPMRDALTHALDTNTPPEGLLQEMANNHRGTYGETPLRVTLDQPGPDLVPMPSPKGIAEAAADMTPAEHATAAKKLGLNDEELAAAIAHHANSPEVTEGKPPAVAGAVEPNVAPSPGVTVPADQPIEAGKGRVATPAERTTPSGASAEPPAGPAGPAVPVGEPVTPRQAPEVAPLPQVEPNTPLTGARKSVTDAEREARGLSPVEMQKYRIIGPEFEQAKANVEGGKIDPITLARDVAGHPRQLDIPETAALTYQRAKWVKEDNGIISKMASTDNPIELQQLKDRRQVISDYMDTNEQALRRGGREQSAAFAARKLIVNDDFSPSTMMTLARANKGAPLAEGEIKIAEGLGKRVQALESKIADMESKASEKDASTVLAKARTRTFTKDSLATERQGIMDQFAKLTSKVSSTPIDMIPEGMKLLGQLAVNLAREGVLTLDDLLSRVQSHLAPVGVDVTKNQLVDAVNDHGKRESVETPQPVKNVAEIKKQAQLQKAIDDIRAGVPGPARAASNLQSAEVQRLQAEKTSANQTPDEIIKEAAKGDPGSLDELLRRVQSRLPGATRSDILDALTHTESKPTTAEQRSAQEMRKQARTVTETERINQAVADKTYTKPSSPTMATPSPEMQQLQVDLDRAKSAAKNFLASRERTPTSEAIKQFYRANLVSGLGIPFKVYNSFAMGRIADTLGSVPAAAWDRLLSTITGRRASMADVSAVMDGLKDAKMRASVARSLNIIKGVEPSSSHASLSPSFHGVNLGDSPIGKGISGYINTVFNTHSALYSPLLDYGYRKSLGEQASLAAKNAGNPSLRDELLANPTKEMQARAAEEAKEGILMNHNRLGSLLGDRSGLRDTPSGRALDLLATTFVPVPGVASNAAGRLLEHSPMGFAKGLSEASEASTKSKAGDIEGSFAAQRQSSKAMGRATVGLAAMYAGYQLAKHGLLTGQYDQGVNNGRTKERGAYGNIQIPGVAPGKQNYAIDESPIGMLMSIGAISHELEDRRVRGMPDTFWAHLGNAASMSPLGRENPIWNIKQTLEQDVKDPAKGAANAAMGFVPASGALGSIARTTDYGVDRRVNGIADLVKSKLPGLRQTLPKK
jgi:hypothetical protein